MKKILVGSVFGFVLSAVLGPLAGHERETTNVTWGHTISRIVFERCGSCHHDGGTAFSLMTYDQARPWAVAIREEILSRTMPPWGAVQGFGEFRNEAALSPAQMNLIVSWVEGGVPEGNPEDLPDLPDFSTDTAREDPLAVTLVSGETTLGQALLLDGLLPQNVGQSESVQITAELPDGRVKPLLWLYEYREEYGHPFLLETPLELPPGTVIRGVPAGSSVALIPATF